ncbi:SRPBCC family protein [Hirschia litorea]|uniref:SRPBCC domain-containing protein n=1 Tax=Hirschia litorea TaxID=1199156 RepID=A0ABW2ILJ4_9PROT
MTCIPRAFLASSLFAVGFATSASADILNKQSDHYTIKQEATSSLPPEKIWQRLIDPAQWWHPDHTYSGSSANLSLDVQAGGLWREDWQGGSIAHGQILSVMENKQLTLNAPFGPLQNMAVTVIWTITIQEENDGSKITFLETANGTHQSKLDEIAPAVDYVKTQAIQRLANKTSQ